MAHLETNLRAGGLGEVHLDGVDITNKVAGMYVRVAVAEPISVELLLPHVEWNAQLEANVTIEQVEIVADALRDYDRTVHELRDPRHGTYVESEPLRQALNALASLDFANR
jgi:hypothetical protein